MKSTGTSRWARPARIRLSLSDQIRGVTALPLPKRRLWPGGIVSGAMFVAFGWVAVRQISSMLSGNSNTVSGLIFVLFEGFWVLGWSVGVLFLLLLTVLLLTYHESAHLTDTRLVYVPRLGPIRIVLEYDLGRIRYPRLENAAGDQAAIRFKYENGDVALGNPMPRPQAESYVRTIRAAIEAHGAAGAAVATEVSDGGGGDEAVTPVMVAARPPAKRDADRPETATSALALLAANLIPLVGVLLLGWDLGQVMVLFWAENAVIGFYNLLKIAVVAKWATVFVGPFFVGHYGGFMVAHLFFIYYMFVRGIGASGPEASAGTALANVFFPLWPALLALFLSHGLSFYTNFLKQREYVGRTTQQQMGEPYKRIVMLHLTIIFGGWGVIMFRSAVPALVLLVTLKIGMDLWAHRKEHRRRST